MNRTILMLEHDEDDRYITQSVFEENQVNVNLRFVTTSQELLKYLETCASDHSPFPTLILLNYYASPLNASEILRDLKSDVRFKHIPTVVLSGSVHPDIVKQCYLEGASSFIQKPSLSRDTSTKITNFIKYWFETVELM
jgi:CheY-like chemotaxis protein